MNPVKFIGRIQKALKDPGRKSLRKLFSEYLYFKFTNPSIASQYFHKRLYRKNVNNPEDYILTHKLEQQIWHFNDMDYFSILIQKLNTEMFFSKYHLPVVKSMAYNINSLFFRNGDFVQIHTGEHFRDFLNTLRKESVWETDHIIIKPREHTWGGAGIFIIAWNELTDSNFNIGSIFMEIKSSGYLFQNCVLQHPELDKINPNSVNTIRVDTFTNEAGITKILCMRLRTSAGTSFLDNISNGGLFIGIDENTGLLHKEGFTDFNKFSGESFTKHPLTKTVFKGFAIPYFEQVKKLATDAANLLPRAKVLAWDIAVTPDGPVILEGNYFPGLLNSEIVQRGFRNNTVFSEMRYELENTIRQKEGEHK